MFKKGTGDWTKYRGDGVREVDFHRSSTSSGYREAFDYREAMAEVERDALDALSSAYADGIATLLLTYADLSASNMSQYLSLLYDRVPSRAGTSQQTLEREFVLRMLAV
jgi:hypothetical protein